jgi:4-carboxymuconolactone decarboxylase
LADGRLIGPFNVFLYSPEISQAFNGWVDAEAKCTSLSPTVRQIIILTVGAAWNSAYEFYAHTAAARTVGISDKTIGSIEAGREPERISAEETTAYRFTHTLVTKRTVDPELYQRAVSTFGEKGVVDMIHLIGLYLATSALLNAFSVPAPTGSNT